MRECVLRILLFEFAIRFLKHASEGFRVKFSDPDWVRGAKLLGIIEFLRLEGRGKWVSVSGCFVLSCYLLLLIELLHTNARARELPKKMQSQLCLFVSDGSCMWKESSIFCRILHQLCLDRDVHFVVYSYHKTCTKSKKFYESHQSEHKPLALF